MLILDIGLEARASYNSDYFDISFTYWAILHGKNMKTKLECRKIRILKMSNFLHNLNFSKVSASAMKNKNQNSSQNYPRILNI